MYLSRKQSAYMLLVVVSFVGLNLFCFAHEGVSHHHHHHHHNGDVGHSHCSHGHSHDHGRVHHHRHDEDRDTGAKPMLPEELAEEEDLKMYGFGSSYLHDRDHDHNFGGVSELSTLALWTHAMGCSFLVSMASLICLIILPLLFFQGKPSKTIVDSLAAFGAGAMLGDAFLHQLPHAFGGKHSHSHDHGEHSHDNFYNSGQAQSHSHSLEDLSVGLSILAGIVLFLLVEKLVRYVEDHSGNAKSTWSHAHHHHSHKKSNKVKIDDHAHDNSNSLSTDAKGGDKSETLSKQEVLDGASDGCLNDQEPIEKGSLLRKRVITDGAGNKDKPDLDAASRETVKMEGQSEGRPNSSSSNLVFGYLNLFSDGVHNFTDGMALGSAFLLHGSVGGWSRTLFLLAHELPQEVGDFGILVRSGFSVSKALFFNFLSALVALAGTALALLFGQDPGQSSLIEGFTAGGFIYIAVAGVLPEMNNGNSTVRSSVIQVMSLISGMAIALCISLVE